MRVRMSADERKLAILNAAKPLFSQNGFNATSVRQIAKAANVSEALLYRHFPSKEAMYQEILEYAGFIASHAAKEFEDFEPGTETLVLLVYALIHMILFEVPGRGEQQKMHERLLFHSMLEDVTYAKVVFKKMEDGWQDIALASYEAAVAEGSMVEMPVAFSHRIWFVHHLGMSLNLCNMSGESAIEYDMSMEDLADSTVHFALRGMGMTDDAIRKFFKPKKLKIFINGIFMSNSHPEE